MDRQNGMVGRRGVMAAAGASVVLAALPRPRQSMPITVAAADGAETSGMRAEFAEAAIVRRHVHGLWGRSDLRLGTLVWPDSLWDRSLVRWCYWWQAHLLDCAVDAAHRARTPERIDRVVAIARGIRSRNLTGWTNRYYDDMSWLVLALERADRLLGVEFTEAVTELRDDVVAGWNPDVGAVPWRYGDEYYNTPTIGPAGIALARLGDPVRAERLADFLHTRLRDSRTGLILDGVHEPGARVDRTVHTYCQGVAIGLETELAVRTGADIHRRRVATLVAATADGLTDDGVIVGSAGDDSGLFMGILARYLAEAALGLGDATAARIVETSARAAWEHRGDVDGLPLFGVEWNRPVTVPEDPGTFLAYTHSSVGPAANLSPDLSVQLSGWMLMEADHRLAVAARRA